MNLPEQAPFSSEQREAINLAFENVSREQAIWLSGYFAGLAGQIPDGGAAQAAPEGAEAPKNIPLTILFGSESGNSEDLAYRTGKEADSRGFKSRVYDMADYPVKKLSEEKNLLILVSTWGDGDPPDRAESFHSFLLSDQAPRLENTHYSVLALGDTSYEQFCQTGKEMDKRLEELGAHRIHPRKDCDVDFEAPYEEWLKGVLPALNKAAGGAGAKQPEAVTAAPRQAPAKTEPYGRKNPFPSELTERILLNGTGSAKEIYHFEFSLENSGIIYEPGDALGVVPCNDPTVVDAILQKAEIDPKAQVESKSGEKSIRQALIEDYEITVLTSAIVKKYLALSRDKKLESILNDRDKLRDWLYGKQLADLFFEFPVGKCELDKFLELLRKLPPRLYSIASSLMAHPDSVHLTVGAVRYNRHGLPLNGVASTYLSDRIDIGDKVPVYIQKNKNFRLPSNGSTPIIMVGPGTGIAPFRAFIEERKARGADGKSWLFFGDQHFNTDFLYQLEWQAYLKEGALTRINTAFSRDQKHKIYVQDRMLENAADLYSWIEDGAHFYVCGDASRMAKDVHEALIKIIEQEGKRSREEAEAYVKQLQKDKRYQRDIY